VNHFNVQNIGVHKFDMTTIRFCKESTGEMTKNDTNCGTYQCSN